MAGGGSLLSFPALLAVQGPLDPAPGGTGEILIDSLVWRVGYWGDRASLAMMAELAAVLAGGQEGAR